MTSASEIDLRREFPGQLLGLYFSGIDQKTIAANREKILYFRKVMITMSWYDYNNYNYNNYSGSSGITDLYSEWSSVKSGSYGKALKVYYSGDTAASSKASSARTSAASSTKSRSSNVLDEILRERKYPTLSNTAQKANSDLSEGISSLSNSLSVLQNKNTYKDSEKGESAVDKVASALANYVSAYNDTVNASKKSTVTRAVQNISSIVNSSKANADKLAEIGITLNSDNTISFDKNKLASADLSKVQELFSGRNLTNYGSVVDFRLDLAGLTALPAATGSTETTGDTEKSDVEYAGAASLGADITALTADSLYEKDSDGKYNVSKIFDAMTSFVGNYNKMIDDAKGNYYSGVASNLARIMEKTEKNREALSAFGISIDNKGKLTLNEDTFKKSDMSQFNDFFKQYGPSIATNVSLVNYYMTTHADASSGYTAAGAYNVQGGFRYDVAI